MQERDVERVTRVIGIDGCPAGWFYVLLKGRMFWEAGIVPDGESLWRICSLVDCAFIDIPIGLPYLPEQRECDRLARKILGRSRASSVFPVPCRQAVYAETYDNACRINQKVLGMKISCQLWNIAPKIRQIDRLFQDYSDSRTILREIHPEVCFWALDGGRPMNNSKKTHLGFYERLAVLQKVMPISEDIVQTVLNRYRRKDFAPDDVLDALAAAVTAGYAAVDLITLPEHPHKDQHGLPMEIVYPLVARDQFNPCSSHAS